MIKWLLLLLFTTNTYAAICHGQMVSPASIQWQGLLPITIGSTTVESSSLPDTSNPSNAICACGDPPFPKVGIAVGYWEPMGLVDVTRTPYCLVNVGGVQWQASSSEGEVDNDNHGSFYYVHYYNFPIIKLLNTGLLGGACKTDGVFTLVYLSELDPTWTKGTGGKTAESLAAIVFPETLLLSNPITSIATNAACSTDSIAADTHLPLNKLFWCMGSQGLIYPLTGRVAAQTSTAQATTLLAERGIYKLHRLGFIADTNKNNLCHETTELFMPKNRYRYQMIYPKVASVEPFGRTTSLWDSNAFNVINGDDAGYLIWRKRNCCNY